MGSEVTTLPQLSAFIVPFADLDADHAVFTGTESNPATHPVAVSGDTESSLRLSASGDPLVGRDIRLRVQRGGFPSGLAGLSLAWRNTASEDWLGWDGFGLQTQYRLVAWSTSTTLGYQTPDVISLPSGVVVAVFDEPVSTSRRAVRVRRWTPTAKAWAAASTTVYEEPSSNVVYGMLPCICQLPSGRILIFHYKHQTTYTQVWSWYSDDEGLTWSRGQRDVLENPIDRGTIPMIALRCAYGAGEISLVVPYNTGGAGMIQQYSSRDGGNRFALAATLGGVGIPGGIVTVGLKYTQKKFLLFIANSSSFSLWRAGTASQAFGGITADVDFVAGAAAAEYVTLCTDEQDNVYYIQGYDQPEIYYSTDAGSSWSAVGGIPIDWASNDGALVNVAACVNRGAIRLLGNYRSGGVINYGIVEVQLGGYTSLTVPEKNTPDVFAALETPTPTRVQVPWTKAWMGYEGRLDAFTGWANADTGAPTYGTAAGYEAIACGVGDASNTDATSAATAAYYELRAQGSLLQNSGTSVIELRSSDTSGGGQLTRVTLTISTTAITLDDDLGAGTATAAYTAGNRVDVAVALKGRKAAAWYRVFDGDTARRWTLIGTLTLLTESAGAPPANRIRRIVSASSGANWYEMRHHFDTAPDIEDGWSDGQVTSEVFGRPAAATVGGSSIDDGVSIQVTDGPGYPGETFLMEGGGARPIERAFPLVSPSPQDYAEIENGDDIDVGIEWDDTRDPGNDAIGVYLDCPVYAAELWIDEGAGAAKIGDLNTAFQIEFVRRGDTLVTPESGSAGHLGYIENNELAGGWVVIDPDGADYTARITGNTAGRLDDGASLDEKRATIFISGLDPAAPTSGTVRVIPPRSVTVAALFGHRAILSAFVRINPTNLRTGYPAPPWGTIRIRAFNLGRVDFLGWSPARDHSVQRESVVSVTDMPSGARWSRRMNPRTRRIVEFSVSSDSIDISKSRGVHDDDYLRASQTAGSEPVAARHDAPLLVAGLLDEIDGAGGLVTWVPAWDPNGDDVQSWCLQHAGGALHGRITSEARLENVVGYVHGDQVVRGPRVVLEEEI